MEAMLGQSRRGVNPRSGQVTVQTQPPLAEQETNPTSAPNHLVFLEKAECVRSFSPKLEDDRRGIYISGLAIDKEHMFVVDIENNRTKVFTHERQFKFDIKVNRPCDVAVSQTGHLYITSHGDSCVQVYSTRGQQVTTMGQGLLEIPLGITLNRQGHVMVCDREKKSIFTFHADSGQLLNTIPLSMCIYPAYITVNSVNDNIVISDWDGRCVHVLSPTGDHLYKYDCREGSELRKPSGVCTDSYGHIFIADFVNNRIVALSPQGQFIRYIVTKDDGLWSPQAVVINPAGQLVVVEDYGNVKTFQYIELKQGQFSEEINRQDPLLQEAYQQACKDGFERVKRARVMLLGHYGAGKTHLRKRLLGKEYDEDKDPITNGIETDYVLVKEGWNSDEAECHGPAISHLLAVNTRKIHEEIRASHAELQPLSQVVEATNVPTSEKVEKSTSKSPEMQSDVIEEKIIAVAPKLEDENTLSTGGQISATQDKEREHQPSPSSSKEALSYLKTEESMELPPDVLTHLTESSYDIENPPARLAVWDFGGQSVYYNTHHTFLSSRAIYILAIDMSLALTDRLDDQWHGAEHFSGTILDFTYYWIDAIHTYAQQQNMSEDGVSSPRIIIACTHKDKYLENVPKEKHEEEINAYFDKLRQYIQQKRSGVHVDPRFFAIDNTCQDEDQEISDLRRYIMKIAESQKSWGEKNPIRWIRLEEDLQLRRSPEKRGKRWIRYEELQNLALKVGMQDAIELKSFLQFHHDIGDLMHFQTDDLSDTVILNPTWLIDAFRSIIAVDKHHVKAKGTPYWSALKRGILDERLLDELWGDDSELKSIVISVMVQFNILLQQDVKPGKPTSRQFYVPSLLQICKNPESGVGSEGTLFIQGKENFMPHVLFNRLTVKLVQNDTSSGRKGLRRRGDFFLFQNELYYDYAVYVIDPLRRARCALRKSTKSSSIELIPLYPLTTKFDRTIRGAYAKWKNHVSMQIQQVKQTICPHLHLEWCVRDPRKPKVRDELMAIDPKETDLTECGLPEDSVYRLWFMPDSSEKEDSVTPPATTLPSVTGGNRDGGILQEEGMLKLPASPQTRHHFLRRFSITPEGGHVHLKEVGVFLLVPPGALSETTEMFIGISWREEDMPPLPPCQTRASPVVVCGPHGLTFRTPVYLSFYHCISGTRQRKMGKIYPESLTQSSRMDNPFYIWQSETHLNDPCQWKVLSSDSVVLTNTKCILTMNHFCKHSLSCDSKRLSALVFGSLQPQHVPLLKLMVCCVNDTRDELESVTTKARELLLMEMLDLEKKFQFLTCEHSESEEKESYDVSLLLDGFETEWKMHKDSPKKVIKYIKLLKNETEHVMYVLSPKMVDRLDVLDCKIHIKQEVSKDQEEDIKVLTSTEFDIHWILPVAPLMDLYNLNSYSGGAESVRSAPQRSSHPLPQGELQRHDGGHFQSRPSQQYYQQDPYQQNQPRIQSDIASQQDDFQFQTVRKMVVQGQYQQNQPSLQPTFRNQWLQQGNFQSQTLPDESAGPNIPYHQQGQSQHSRLPQEPVTDHHLEEQGGDHFQTRRKSGHDFPSLPPQQDPVAAGDQDQSVTDPQTTRTMGNQAISQAYRDNQLERLPTAVTHGIAGVLRHYPANTGNTHITVNVQQVNNYTGNSDKESMAQMKEKDVTTSFHKHIPPHVKKRLNETLSQNDVWNQVKKMYGISDETPRPPDVVASLLSQVDGSIASFISVFLKLKERHREGQQDIPQDLIDEVKKGLLSEMEYNRLREKVVDFAEELSIHIERILDYLYQFSVIPDEETTKLKNDAKRNPQEACRGLFKALLAISPKKEPIKHLKAAFRDCGLGHLADELEVSYKDVDNELQKHGGGRPSCEEPLAIGIAAPPTPATGENPTEAH